MSSLAAILPAAGSAVRFGADKLAQRLDGMSVFCRALAPFAEHPEVAEIVIATKDESAIRTLIAADLPELRARLTFAAGGVNRAESVLSALRTVDASCEWVAVHDAARPLVTRALIDATLACAREHGAAAPALRVSNTIKQAGDELPSVVASTLPRQQLYALQTPQIARRTDLLEAYEQCPRPLDTITDDLQLLELIGRPTWLCEGDPTNIKITHPRDIAWASYLASAKTPDNPG